MPRLLGAAPHCRETQSRPTSDTLKFTDASVGVGVGVAVVCAACGVGVAVAVVCAACGVGVGVVVVCAACVRLVTV